MPSEQVLAGAPRVGVETLHAWPDGRELGVWEIAVGSEGGAVTDVEADEAFVVLSGRATIDVAGGPTHEVGPGDVVVLDAGARTVWTVHETLRKVWLTGPAGK
ncbi:MAG: cupin domain-containing protein [Motilibacteraceae bacterium]